MSARIARAAVVAATVLLIGLILGLSLGTAQDTGTSEGPAGGAGTGAGTSEPAVSVPEEQANLVDAKPLATDDPAVPSRAAPAETAADDPKSLAKTTVVDALGQTQVVPLKPAPVTGRAVGNAQLSLPPVKRREARVSCAAHQPRPSDMLAVGSGVAGTSHRSLTWLLAAIAALAALVALVAVAARRRREARTADGDGEREPPKPKTPLEIVSSAVAILGTLATFGVAYLGTGVKDRPPPSIEMKVREVHARITHGRYAKKMGESAGVRGLDRREIGNVVWLELHFAGYRDADLQLQYAAFEPRPGEPLIASSAKTVGIHVDGRSDVHTEFWPIWIGIPRVPRFRAEFRILDHGQVRQIASTDEMRGIAYRYTC